MGRVSSPEQTSPPVEQNPVPQFDLVFRGYDRRQVDERLSYLASELRSAEAALRRADHTEAELRQLRQQVSAHNENTFGFRVEKILRLAEEEAKEARDQANAEADAHRREVEQEIAERTAAMEQQERELADKRASVERQLQAMRAQAERDADGVRVAAEQQAGALREQVQSECDQLRAETERELARRRDEMQRRIDELIGVRDRLGGQLRQAQDAIAEVIGRHLVDRQVT